MSGAFVNDDFGSEFLEQPMPIEALVAASLGQEFRPSAP
jgi:hypothetical protein